MKSLLLFFALICISSFEVRGQQQNFLLKGELCPDIYFQHVKFYKSSAAHLHDFLGKLIIIHNWASWCMPCIDAFPRLDSLQKKFGDSIQVLLNTTESDEVIDRVFGKLKKIRSDYHLVNIRIDSIIMEKLYNLNGNLLGGGDIFIDGHGYVLGRSEDLSDKNIRALLHGTKTNSFDKSDDENRLYLKSHLMDTVNSEFKNASISTDAEIIKGHVNYFSMIGKYQIGKTDHTITFRPASGPDNVAIFKVTNTTIFHLYAQAYGEALTVSRNGHQVPFNAGRNNALMKFNVSDVSMYAPGSWDSAKFNNGYCYELKMPGADANTLLTLMQQDLARFFRLKVRKKNMEVNCFVLKKMPGQTPITSGDKTMVEFDNYGISIANGSVKKLTDILGKYVCNNERPLIFDESGIKRNIDINIVADLRHDLRAVNASLSKYHLKLVKSKREVAMLIFSDK